MRKYFKERLRHIFITASIHGEIKISPHVAASLRKLNCSNGSDIVQFLIRFFQYNKNKNAFFYNYRV